MASDRDVQDVMSSSQATGFAQLDRAQDILFDQFSPYLFSLQVLQNKNVFNPNDVILGGSSEFDLQHWQGDKIEEYPPDQIYQKGNGLYFTQANVDLMVNPNSWSTVFFSLLDNHIGRNDAAANNIYLNHAFIVVGDLKKFPVYGTAGINTIPFGVLTGSGQWDTPLTAAYFNPAQAPQLSIGYDKNDWNMAATGFEDQTNYKTHYAYSLYYNKDNKDVSYGLGIGYLTDLKANATNSSYNHKNLLKSSALAQDDLGAILDLNGNFRYQQLSVNAEYDLGHKRLPDNQSKPEAYALAMDYVKNIAGKNTTFGVSHSVALHLKDVPANLAGYDTLTMALSGLENTWSINVSRSLNQYASLCLDLQRSATPSNENTAHYGGHSYTATLDLITYL